MGSLVASLALLALAGAPAAAAAPAISKDGNHFSQKVSRGKETIRVDVRLKPFQASGHQLKLIDGAVEKVDGHSPLGTDAGAPEALKTEVSALRVTWDGVTADVRKDLFHPRRRQ